MTIAQVATIALGAGLVFLGVREAVAPRAGARGYGIPVAPDAEPTPYLQVKANRDIALGGFLTLVACESSPGTLASALYISALCPAWDAALVLRHGRPRDTIIHVATVAYILIAALLTQRGR